MMVQKPPFLGVKTIEKTGAGDTFEGCALNYLLDHDIDSLNEEDLSQLLVFANAGASLITTRKGALKVMPERSEIEELILTSD
jgi:fructokinase